MIEENVDSTVEQSNVENVETMLNGNEGLVRTAIGAFVGAVIGAVAVNVARQLTVENVNKSVKGIGNAVKGAAEGINSTAKGVGNAVKSVAENANDTVKDVGDTIKLQAEDLNLNVKETVDVVRVTTQSVGSNVKGTADVVKGTAKEVNNTVKDAVDVVYEQEIENQSVADEIGSASSSGMPLKYVLVPVDNGKVVGQPIPIDLGASVIPGKTDSGQ